ncbi:hypothetical protein [Limnobaculum xujianqingii]|uniref:hypothetical protein n=1 Tax=Limnobaculum xujianqingii TaxID=2738837 RepID=UPI00112757C3|nr:hypothetical protein [Limnobaculum xujianqingii]
MWFPAWLKFPQKLAPVTCSVVPVHPWTFGAGHQEESGSYLSPSNAVEFLVKKLNGVTDDMDILIIMLAETHNEQFMQALSQLTAIFPLPVFKQVERLAQSFSELAITKMQIPSITSALPAPIALSVDTCRSALTSQLIAEAQSAAAGSVDIDSIKASLSELKDLRSQMASEASGALEELQKGSAAVWAFSASGNINTILTTLQKDIPLPSAIHTAAVMFVGDVAPLKEMITCRELF